MTYRPGEFAPVRYTVLLLSGMAWILLLLNPAGVTLAPHCSAAQSGGRLALGWAVMLVATMAPVLIGPIGHIYLRSFKHRRLRSVALFVSGYGAIWMALGCLLIAIGFGERLFAPQSYLPLAGVAIIALVWQVSPLKQRCLNACHTHTELAAFGAPADLSALRFGLSHGFWCAGSCWALMLFPMLLPGGHLFAMAAVAILIFSERLEPPMAAAWRWRGLGGVTRMAVVQTRILLTPTSDIS
jgi:predicted metal-binding membrane protein